MKKLSVYICLCLLASLFVFSYCSDKEKEEICEKEVWYQDSDLDGFGNPNATLMACIQPNGYIKNNLDCNDLDTEVNPSATEVNGDGIDNNCNGAVDEVCIPDCSGKSCGSDGCGGSCGSCDASTTCSTEGVCE